MPGLEPQQYNPLEPIVDSDTFKQWADKCNQIIAGINQSNFLFDAGVDLNPYIRKDQDHIVEASAGATNWSFSQGTTVTVDGPLNVNGVGGNETSFTGSGKLNISKRTEFSGAEPVIFNQAGSSPLLTFQKSGGVNNTIGYSANPGTLGPLITTAHWETPKLINSGSDININNINYTWPEGPSVVKLTENVNRHIFGLNLTNPNSPVVEIEDRNSFINQTVTEAIAGLGDTNFVLPVELIPVGTRIHVPYEVIDTYFTVKPSPAPGTGWPEDNLTANPQYEASNNYPGWRVCDGSVVEFDDNASPINDRYKRLIQLLDTSQIGSSGSITLPNGFDEAYELVLNNDNNTWHVIRDADEAVPAGYWNVNLDIIADSRELSKIYYISGTVDLTSITTSGSANSFGATARALADTRGNYVWNSISDVRTNVSPEWRDTFTQLATLGGNNISKTRIKIYAGDLNLSSSGDDQEHHHTYDITIDWVNDTIEGIASYIAQRRTFNQAKLKNSPIGTHNDFDWVEAVIYDSIDGYPRISLDVTNRRITALPIIDVNISAVGYNVSIEEFSGNTESANNHLNRNFLVPSNKYLHFKADDVTAGSYDLSYAITNSASTPTRAAGDWTTWDTITGPTPSEYHGVVTNLSSGAMLIKAEPDNSSTFLVQGGNGINIIPKGPQTGSLVNAFDIYGTNDLSLDVNTDDFNFTQTGTLELKESIGDADVWDIVDNDNPIPRRTTSGQMRANHPVETLDLTTKGYVDAAAGSGAVNTLNETRGDMRYASNPDIAYGERAYGPVVSHTGVDRDDFAMVNRNNFVQYYGVSAQYAYLSGLNSWTATQWADKSKLGDNLWTRWAPNRTAQCGQLIPLKSEESSGPNNAKKTINLYNQLFVIDEDDIIYLRGNHVGGYGGKSAQNDGGDCTHHSLTDGSSRSDANMRNDLYRAVTNDSINRGMGFVPAMVPNDSGDDYIKIDWYETDIPPYWLTKQYGNLPTFIVKQKNIPSSIYGRIIHAGMNDNAQFSNGARGFGTTKATGPVAWGISGSISATSNLWRQLWDVYATNKSSDISKSTSFHYSTSSSSQWYIKKVWSINGVTFVLVQQNSDSTGANAELWASGNNAYGTCGWGGYSTAAATNASDNADLRGALWGAPVVTNNILPNLPSTSSVVSNQITTSSAHGLRDWSWVVANGNQYIIKVISSTKFELYDTINKRGADGSGTSNNKVILADAGITPGTSIRPLETLKGVTQITGCLKDTINTTSFEPDLYQFEQNFLALRTDGSLYGWGENEFDSLGLSGDQISSATNITAAQYTGSSISNTTCIAIIGGGEKSYQKNESVNYQIRRDNSTGQKSLWGVGNHIYGRLGKIRTASISTRWFKISSSTQNVEKVFVDEGGWRKATGNGSFGQLPPRTYYISTNINDSTERAKLFVMGKMYAGNGGIGLNTQSMEYVDDGWMAFNHYYFGYATEPAPTGDVARQMITAEPIEVPFSEDPMNIVSIGTNCNNTLALCKDDGDITNSNGRLYMCGETIKGLLLPHSTGDTYHSAHHTYFYKSMVGHFTRVDHLFTTY